MKVVPAIGLVLALSISTPAGFAADFNGDGTNDIAIFRPSSGLWAIRDGARVYFGGSGDEPMPGDYDGDGTVDIAIFRESNGLWAVDGGLRDYFGGSGDVPIAGIQAGGGGSPWQRSVATGDLYYFDGNIGIGVANPSAPLMISENSTPTFPQMILYEQGTNDYARLTFRLAASSDFFTLAGMPKNTTADARMHIYYNETGNLMSFTGDGKVGIGTGDPAERLTVKMGGTEWTQPHLALEASDSTDKWDFTIGSSNRLYVGFNETSLFYARTDGGLRMENGTGGYYSATTHSWVNGSTRSIKQDIKPNEMNVGEILDKVNIVNYRYKREAAADENAPYHIGFIAEDTPELLSSKERNGMVTGDCIGLLLAAVKEQQSEIERLSREIKLLKSSTPR